MSSDILFIHINEWGEYRSPDTTPISQAYQLACLQANGFSGRILGDYKDRPLSPSVVREVIRHDRPLALGFTVYEENINRVRVWASYAKDLAPDLPVILGGPQITFMPGDGLLHMPEADALCRGEGETVILELARSLREGQGLEKVPGICVRQGDSVIETGPVPAHMDLDSIPSPYLSDIIDPCGEDRVIFFTSRGCASNCRFCYTPKASGRRVRYHSLDRVVDELRYLAGKGARDIWFADPNFAASKSRLVALLEAIIERVPGITFWCQTRYDQMDKDLARLLKRAGAHTVAFGLESANPEVLQAIDKRLDTEKMAQAIRTVQQAGMEVELFTLFGLPGESFDQACQTLDFVKANGVAVEGNSISQQLHLFFGTPIESAPAEHGILPHDLTKPSYLAVCRDFETNAMSREEIRRMGLLWRLHRTDFADDVIAGRNLFERAGLITSNSDILSDRPEADACLARIFLHLEEYERAAELLDRLQHASDSTPAGRALLSGPFTGYKAARRAVARPGCRVIFDCRGMLDGVVVPATQAFYQEAVIGDKTLLPDFEQGILGLRGGGVNQFDVRFPDDYGNRNLAGRTLTFMAYLHRVLEPVEVGSIADVAGLPRNMYRFSDLAGLHEHNEKLYYLVLRDMVFRSLRDEITDFLALLHFKLKLGFLEEAQAMYKTLPRQSEAARLAGRILLASGRPEEAIIMLEPSSSQESDALIDLIKAHIQAKNYHEAERLAAVPLLANDIHALDLRVGLASFLQMPVTVYLERMQDLLRYQKNALRAQASN